LRKRTRARELALQALYQLDLRPDLAPEDISEFLRTNAEDPNVLRFAQQLVDGCREHLEEIDGLIRAVAENWDIRRMAVVDRNILRLSVYEMKHMDDIPPKVSINEAVELGKRYSTVSSGSFINGILDRINKDMPGPGDAGPGPDSPGS
jgi:transcription antitermination factor NusB